jgi:hypothetical protein
LCEIGGSFVERLATFTMLFLGLADALMDDDTSCVLAYGSRRPRCVSSASYSRGRNKEAVRPHFHARPATQLSASSHASSAASSAVRRPGQPMPVMPRR